MNESLKNIIEAALMAAGRPLTLDHLQRLFEERARPEKEALREVLNELQRLCAGRGVEIVEVAGGWRMQVRESMTPWINRLWEEKPARYSRALLETLALIAYRQPITRGEIEAIRGVTVSTRIMNTLHERGWVRILGHRDAPGHPALYGTTREFLNHFGLRTLEELPTLIELQTLSAPERVEESIGNDGDVEETFPAGDEQTTLH